MANFITALRILFSLALLFCPAFSPAFYGLYAAAGLTDMIDGPVARKTNTVSAFGSGLDTAADFVLVAVCLLRLLPLLEVPVWLWVWIGLIGLIKAVNVVSGFVVRKRFTAVHTVLNKAVGGLLFVLPLTLSLVDLRYSGAVVCAAATAAAVQEGHLIRSGGKRPAGAGMPRED